MSRQAIGIDIGGSKTAITKSDGTFALVAPSTVVNVTAATPTANEAGPVNGVFTITRTGDLGLPLTVNYTMGGTATAGGGGDYVALPGSVTFQAGAISTNLTVAVTDDSEVEFTETAILTIGGSPDYAIGTGAATVNILDDEPATITLASATGETRLLEGYSAQKLSFTLTRKGLLSSALDINLAYSGTATASADYNAPASVALAADAVTVTAFVTPIDDDNYEGNETLGVAISAGTGYISGTPSATNVTVIEDDYPAGTVLFADNFDTDSSGLWTVNAFDGANASATFAEDYSVTGYVPPSKPGGTTKGRAARRWNGSTCCSPLGPCEGLTAWECTRTPRPAVGRRGVPPCGTAMRVPAYRPGASGSPSASSGTGSGLWERW